MRIRNHHVVYQNPAPTFATEVYSGTALTVVRGDTSDLTLCGFRLGSAKVSPDGRVVLRQSTDGGETWEWADSPLNMANAAPIAPPGGLRQIAGPHLGSSPDGIVILGAARMTLAPPGTSEFRSDVAGIVDGECVLVRKSTEGWSTPTIVDGRRSAAEWAIVCAPPVALGSGRWFVPAERHAASGEEGWLGRYHAFSLTSVDDGASWTVQGDMVNDPDQVRVYYDQHVVSLGDGQLLSVAWTHDVIADETVSAHAAFSADEGASWSEPWDTGIRGGPVGVAQLADGRLFATYPRRVEPLGIRACLSEDGGRTWDLSREIVIWDELTRSVVGGPPEDRPANKPAPLWETMWGWTFGLPTPALYSDGSVGVVFYAAGADGLNRVIHVRIDP